MTMCATCTGTGLVETAEHDSRAIGDGPCPDCVGAALRPHLGEYHHPRWHLSCADCSALIEDDGEEAQAAFLEGAWAEGWRAVAGDLVCAGCSAGRAPGTDAVSPVDETRPGSAGEEREQLIAALAAEYAEVLARRGTWRRDRVPEVEMERANCALGAERALHKVALRLGLAWDELRERARQLETAAAPPEERAP